MTRTEKLRKILVKIAALHEEEIKTLSYRGKRGGHNAKTIQGWSKSTNNITRAAGLPMMCWWDGSNPTPSTAIPTCCVDEALAAEKEIFN